MDRSILFLSAALYGVALGLDLWDRWRINARARLWTQRLELLAFATFSLAIALFMAHSVFGETLLYRRSIAWIFFAWALGGAELLTQFLYKNRYTGPFTKAWIVGAVAVLPLFRPAQLVDYFSTSVSWFNFHRVAFVLGYAFFFLGLPLAISFLWTSVIRPFFHENKGSVVEHHLQELDNIHYHLVLWALPLLSLGLFTKILLLLDSEALVTPEVIWRASREEFLGVISWFTCALYLHIRIFWRWRYTACAVIYIVSLCLLTAAHFSGSFLLQV